MNKKWVLSSLVFIFAFTGCSDLQTDINQKVEEKMLQALLSDEDYIKYEQMKENGQLDVKGQYIDSASQENADKVYVTFADNAYLHV